jgi:hypothetical protein
MNKIYAVLHWLVMRSLGVAAGLAVAIGVAAVVISMNLAKDHNDHWNYVEVGIVADADPVAGGDEFVADFVVGDTAISNVVVDEMVFEGRRMAWTDGTTITLADPELSSYQVVFLAGVLVTVVSLWAFVLLIDRYDFDYHWRIAIERRQRGQQRPASDINTAFWY